MRKFKYNYNDIVEIFKNRECELLSKSYKNSKTKLDYKCKCGNITQKTLDRFTNSLGCENCHPKGTGLKPTLEQIHLKFEYYNCLLLETEYINSNTFMKFQCKCGKIDYKKMRHVNQKTGIQCVNCSFHKGESHPMWNPDRDSVEMRKTIHDKCRMAVRNCLRRSNQKKVKQTYKYVGYSDKQLIERMESFPEWNKLKESNWELDHIFPVKAFLDHKIYNPEIINSLDILQPLSRHDNLHKSDKYDEMEFVNWLKTKGINYE